MVCVKCKQERPLEAFNKNQRACRCCQKEYYRQNAKQHRANVKKRRDAIKAEQYSLVQEAKSVSCADCGGSFHYCQMDFDHLVEKVRDVSRLVGGSTKKLLEEMAKCEVVCSNCHRLRTFRRRLALVV